MIVSYASNGEAKIAYQAFGPPDGEPLLLIMGLTYQMIWWPDGFIRELAAQGFAVARFDNRDAGLSTHFGSPSPGIFRTRPGRGGLAYRIGDMADDALAVMDALGWDSAHLLGETQGATLAQVIAIRHPDRVRSLICAMSAGPGGPAASFRYLNLATVLKLARKRYDAAREGGVERLADTYLALCAPGHPVDSEWVRRTAAESWDRDHDPRATGRQLAAFLTAGPIRSRLRRLRVPALVLHGQDDPWISPRAALALASAIPGARLITYPGTGHEFPQHLWPAIARDVHQAARQAAAAGLPGARSAGSGTHATAPLRKDPGMRSRKYRLMTTLEWGSNRLNRFALRAGIAPRAFALLETTGRRTGQPRHTPVGNGLGGNTFWLIAAHGTQSDYVRNLQVTPRVRVKAAGTWRTGTAVVLPDDDALARSRTLPYQWDAAIGRIMASAPLTIRIDLDPASGPH